MTAITTIGDCTIGKLQEVFNISVKNCVRFFAYKLRRVSFCPSAYCFGKIFMPLLNILLIA